MVPDRGDFSQCGEIMLPDVVQRASAHVQGASAWFFLPVGVFNLPVRREIEAGGRFFLSVRRFSYPCGENMLSDLVQGASALFFLVSATFFLPVRMFGVPVRDFRQPVRGKGGWRAFDTLMVTNSPFHWQFVEKSAQRRLLP